MRGRYIVVPLNQTAFVPPFDLYPSGSQTVYIRAQGKCEEHDICIETVLSEKPGLDPRFWNPAYRTMHGQHIFKGQCHEIFGHRFFP